LCEASGIEINFSDQTALPPARKRKIPAKFAESFVSETVDDRPDTKSKEGFQKNVCFPVLDSLLTEIHSRFAETNCSVLKGIQSLNPASDSFADASCLQPFAELYSADLTDLSHELHQAKRLVERLDRNDKPNTMLTFLSYLERCKEAFPELCRIGRIAVALPVSTASCERSFSCLRHLKTWVRNSMANDKLDSVAILAIERERTQLLDVPGRESH